MFKRYFILLTLLAANAAQALSPPPPPRRVITTADGSPIELKTLDISASVSGGTTETTVRMVFYNPNQRQLEGNLQFPLQDGAQVTAFSLDIDGAMRPAVPVEKAPGRAVFEAIERQRIDPALLEVTQGNNFKVRIYPIMPRATRTVELTYAQPLTRSGNHWRYVLPLAYGMAGDFQLSLKVNGVEQAPQIAAGAPPGLRFDRVDGGWQAQVRQVRYMAGAALDIKVPALATPAVYREQRLGADWFVAEVPVRPVRAARPAARVLGLLWDSSGSGRRRALDQELAELGRYLEQAGNLEVRLIQLRDKPEPVRRFRVAGGDWRALRKVLDSTVYDGASALNDWLPEGDVDHYLLVSDGLVNYGGARFPALAARQSLFVLNSALSADNRRLAALAERHNGSLTLVDAGATGALARAMLFHPEARIDGMRARGATDLVVETHNVRDGLARVAGRMLASHGELTLDLSSGGRSHSLTVPLPAQAPEHPHAAGMWAAFRLRALEADYELHRAEIGRIGRRFGIPTRETSLIVLDRLDDYVRHQIEPPAMLADAVRKLQAMQRIEQAQDRTKHLDAVVRSFEQRTAWWKRDFAQVKPQRAGPPKKERSEIQSKMLAEDMQMMPPPPPSPAPAMAMAPSAPPAERKASSQAATPAIGMALKKWTPNAPYMQRLRNASAEDVYRVYLDLKPDYENSTAFYLDAADILFDKGMRDLGLRVLSNLAEMDLENRAVLRILGYRLLQADVPKLAVRVFEHALRLAEEEPQSFRDLGLALAAAGQPQRAVDTLYEVVTRPWDGRFPEIETIVLAELNAIAAAAPKPLDLSRIDPRLRANLALDLRVALTWDADNSDMDLWVEGPNGERCDFSHPLTTEGGRMSRDFTGGYGPEEFSLRRAGRGKYRILANYYGNAQQVLAGATTLQVKVFTGFGTPQQREKMVTLRLKDQRETVFVGEFEVR